MKHKLICNTKADPLLTYGKVYNINGYTSINKNGVFFDFNIDNLELKYQNQGDYQVFSFDGSPVLYFHVNGDNGEKHQPIYTSFRHDKKLIREERIKELLL